MNIFVYVVSYVLFGGDIPQIDVVLLTNQDINASNGYFKNMVSPLHMLTFWLCNKLGLDKEFNNNKRLYGMIKKKLKEVVLERQNAKDYQFGSNAVDLLILKNRDLKAQGLEDQIMSYEQMADSIMSIILAGIDASRNLTESCLYNLSRDQDLQRRLRETISKEILKDGEREGDKEYDNSELLNALITEELRLNSGVPMGLHRKIVKTYTIHKGDLVVVWSFLSPPSKESLKSLKRGRTSI